MLLELITHTRSCRRFDQQYEINRDLLRELVNLARLGASAANIQPLKYILAHTPEKNAAIFPHLAWAAYLKDWPGPVEGERPSAYIVILGDTNLTKNFWCDHGIAAQNILLGATERGLGGCIVGAIQRDGLRKALNIPAHYDFLLVIALGKPTEKVVLETVGPDGNIRYWRDQNGTHHVPKRPLDQIILD
jgi:nitroreductase